MAIGMSLILFWASGCERDDICADGTPITPRLKINFFDNQENTPKAPAELQVSFLEEDGREIVLDTMFTQDSIAIPLPTDRDSIDYIFTINSDTSQGDGNLMPNSDRLRIKFNPEEEFVSRACGFRIVYTSLSVERQEEDEDENRWILRSPEIIAEQNAILNEEGSHIRIFH